MSTSDVELRAGVGPDRRRVALLVTAVVLAAAAAGAVVLADDARWLRLGVVAALWAALLAVVVLARRAPARAAGGERSEERLEALQRRHERELSREAAAREDEVATARRETESRRQDEIAALREEVERLRSHADAVTVQPLEVRPARLRVVGEGAPPPQRTATHRPVPTTPGDRPHHLRPAPVSGPTAVSAPVQAPAPMRGDRAPHPDPSVVAAGSFLDQYVRAAGHEPGRDAPADSAPPVEATLRTPVREARGGAANRMPSAAWDAGPSATTGRTVAELLAAHAAASGPGGRRRRDER
jgi:hypothetical protein